MGKWRLRSSDPVLQSKWLQVRRNSYFMPDGSVLEDYYVIERDDFVLVVAHGPHGVALVRQYRPATDEFYYSLPAGFFAGSESPRQAAIRELKEETGLEASDVRVIGELDPLPGYIKSRAYVLLCSNPSGGICVQDRKEILSAGWRSWDSILVGIRNGEIREMQAVAAILMARIEILTSRDVDGGV